MNDLSALPKELQSKGAKVIRGPEETFYHTREIEIENCNGYVLCFGQTSRIELAVKREGRSRGETGLVFCSCPYFPRLTPITFPLTMISTRRFSFRPAAVLLSAMGSASPSPLDVMVSADNPCAIKNCRTVSARC